MKSSAECLALIKHFEGLRLRLSQLPICDGVSQ